jgi:hypothetical protein
MNLKGWLDGLAEAFNHKPTKLESFEYLQELKTWVLTDDQWLEVKSLAKRRHDFFPRLSELLEISQQVRRDRVPVNGNGAVAFELFTHDDGRRYARRPKRGGEAA